MFIVGIVDNVNLNRVVKKPDDPCGRACFAITCRPAAGAAKDHVGVGRMVQKTPTLSVKAGASSLLQTLSCTPTRRENPASLGHFKKEKYKPKKYISA